MNDHTNTLDTVKAHAATLADKAKDADVEANVKVGEHQVSYIKGEPTEEEKNKQKQADQRHPMHPHTPL